MATNFPTSLDSLTNPTSTDQLTSPSHADQHANANDAIEALQAKVGVNSSAVTTSLDYRTKNSVVQVVWNQLSVTNFQTTASTIQDTGFSVTFTPKYSTSKVLHVVTIGAYYVCDGQLKIYRGSTPAPAVDISLADSFRDVSTTNYIYDMPPTTVTLLDSPATTSQITYRLYAFASGCGRTCYVGTTGDFTPSWLLMEIAQ